MAEKIYLCLFILCAILCQGIAGDFSDVGKSNSPIRRKRVINLEPDEDIPLTNGDAPYIVNIKENTNKYSICVGSILSIRTVITSAPCVARTAHDHLNVVTSSAFKNHGIPHQVIEKKVHLDEHPRKAGDGIALLIVRTDIQFDSNTNRIYLHEGVLLPGTPATIFGWGCNPTEPRGTNHVRKLRAITLPIMHQRDCVNSYRNLFVISDKEICTYHPNKRCGHIDGGAPLIVHNSLAGVYLWSIPFQGQFKPDVFVDIQHLEYGPWIRNNIVHSL